MVICFCVLCSSNLWAKTSVNVLSWWGYINHDHIKKINKKCNVEISLDEYYSNSEFLRRWDYKSQSHDIIIYSNSIHNVIKTHFNEVIKTSRKELYHPIIEKKIKELGLRKNTNIFLISLTGFLGKNSVYKLKESDALSDILNNFQKHLFVITNDSIEGIEIFKKLDLYSHKNNKIFIQPKYKINITNDIENLIEKNDFGLAYFWSGGTLAAISKEPNNYTFIIHPELSHVTSDLVTIVKETTASSCVYAELSSKPFLTEMQSLTYYFSPYGIINEPKDNFFHKFYSKHFESLSKYSWLTSPSAEKFLAIEEEWKKIKLSVKNYEN